jgi:Asp-tRNA(Asn)/Glu-tRNA(Gln) amidotransferase C subunit
MLDLEQLKHLQKLSNINLAQEQQEIFLGNLK